MGAIESARACDAAAAQIWGSNPRSWAPPNVSAERASRFREAWRATRLGPLFLHAPYMVNVASPNEDFRRRSIDLARRTVELAERVDARGVVIHAGAGGASTEPAVSLERAAASLMAVAAGADRVDVLIELTAGGSGSVASRLPQARELIDAAGRHPRLALCLDTCHLFATGYELDSAAGVAACFDELRRLRLSGRLKLVHANDSSFPGGARRDSHTHVGQGHIGEDGFAAILADRSLRGVPIVCETPGRLEDHARNIATLRRLSGSGAALSDSSVRPARRPGARR